MHIESDEQLQEKASVFATLKNIALGKKGCGNGLGHYPPTFLTDTHTVVNCNDHSHQVYTVDSAQTQLFIDQNIVNGGGCCERGFRSKAGGLTHHGNAV